LLVEGKNPAEFGGIFSILLKITAAESFRPPFLKGGAVKGAEPLSPSAEGETPSVLQSGAALGAVLEGVNPPASGRISLLHP
jgi:hypothetical protein